MMTAPLLLITEGCLEAFRNCMLKVQSLQMTNRLLKADCFWVMALSGMTRQLLLSDSCNLHSA